MSTSRASNQLTSNLLVLTNSLKKLTERTALLRREKLRLERELREARITSTKAPPSPSDRLQALATLPRPEGIRRAAVVSWDMGHNPVGRAYVLYDLLTPGWDTTLLGPSWSRYGKGLWQPLRESGIKSRVFQCRSMLDYYSQALIEAAYQTYDLVYVCKPRLPALFLGFLIKEHSGCPLILDIDDHELSFFRDRTRAELADLRAGGASALLEPYEELATRFCETLIPQADAITVSNVALRDLFGGAIIRHARDEDQFNPARFDRAATRHELGIAEGDFALVFVGTPREHKGIFEVAEALHELNDPNICFHIVGDIADRRTNRKLALYSNARIVLHSNCAFNDLPRILSAADCVPLLQDPRSPISMYQMSAKISDATSLGLPLLATDLPPLRDLAGFPGIHFVTRETLKETIMSLRTTARTESTAPIREAFLGEFSTTVNRARLDLTIGRAQESIKPVPDVFRELRDLVGEVFAGLTQDQLASPFPVPALAPHVGTGIDIVFFWKQNDTGLYGRRSDMMAKYLLRSGRINRILFFDAPISIKQIHVLAEKAGRSPNDQASLVLRNTLARWQKGLDQPRLLQRSFIYRESSAERLMARDLPAAEAFPDFVKSEMQDAGFASDRTIAWVCPVVWGFAGLARRIGFRACVADLIDDQRAWDIHPNYRRKLDDAYRLSLRKADVVFTNCEPVALAFKGYAPEIHIVPNGAERFDQVAEVKPFAADPGAPVIGYVGTLRDRIDWQLVESIATRRPDWSFLLAGEAQDNPSVAQLDRLPNVTFPGVVEYPRLLSFLRHLDVGIVPHLVCGLTERMNPLKVYNYFAAGLPIVATELPNVVEMDSFMHKVRDAEEMIAAIEACLRAGRRAGPDPRRNAYIEQISWEARVREVLRVLDPLLDPAFTPAGEG